MARPRNCDCGTCQKCKEREYQRAWRAKNPEKQNAYARTWRSKNPEKSRAATSNYRARNLEDERRRKREWYDKTGRLQQRRDQGIKDAHLADEVLREQGGVCAVCGTADPGGSGGFHADHDHETGLLRGMLCSRHNTALGLLSDRLDLAENLVEYLKSPPAQRVRDRQK